MKTPRILIFLAALVVLFCGCAKSPSTTPLDATGTATPASTAVTSIDTTEMFTQRDSDITSENPIAITLPGKTSNSNSVKIADGSVTITAEGSYTISGTLSDGAIIVDAPDSAKIQLELNNVNINSASSAAIYVKCADKVFITTATQTNNTLSNGGVFTPIDDNNIDSVIFSKSDLTLNGAGTLNISTTAGHGIVSKDDLVITSGTYNITAANHGLSGKDSVRIAGGTFTLSTGKDGIHSENTDVSDAGFVCIVDGAFAITSVADGISASSYVLVQGGNFNITSGGGSKSTTAAQPGFMQKSTYDSTSVSAKAIKAASQIVIENGEYTISSADDAIHSNGSLSISGGKLSIASGDDGIHADGIVTISGGDILISTSYEGIEGSEINISNGTINLTASDDGLNAAGDSSGNRGGFGSDGSSITISGSKLTVNAKGDGIDSNGNFNMSGGTVCVSGPTDNGNGTLDYGGQATITGGVFIGSGSSGMAQNFGTASTQGSMLVTVASAPADSTIVLKSSNGNEIVSFKAEKTYNCVIISCPELKQGETYELISNEVSTQITMDSLIYSSTGFGGGQGGFGGGQGGFGGGQGGFGGRPDKKSW